MMVPVWLNLLRTNKKNRGFGLTLPFLLGAIRTPPGFVETDKNKNISDVKDLLLSIISQTPDASYISITVCDRLRQPVFSEGSSFFKLPDTHARFTNPESNNVTLYVSPQIMSRENEDIECLLKALWERNGDTIIQGNFSYSNGGFTKYSEKDIELITSAVNTIDEEEV